MLKKANIPRLQRTKNAIDIKKRENFLRTKKGLQGVAEKKIMGSIDEDI